MRNVSKVMSIFLKGFHTYGKSKMKIWLLMFRSHRCIVRSIRHRKLCRKSNKSRERKVQTSIFIPYFPKLFILSCCSKPNYRGGASPGCPRWEWWRRWCQQWRGWWGSGGRSTSSQASSGSGLHQGCPQHPPRLLRASTPNKDQNQHQDCTNASLVMQQWSWVILWRWDKW